MLISENWAKLKYWIALFIVVSALMMMVGCSSTGTFLARSFPPAESVVECRLPAPIQGNTGKDISEAIIDLAEAFHDCKDKHDTLRAWANGN